MKVFLDDNRLPPDDSWVWVSTVREAIDLLKSGDVEELSLDYDLGGEESFGTGYDLLNWIANEVKEHGFCAPQDIKVHTEDSAASRKMKQRIDEIRAME